MPALDLVEIMGYIFSPKGTVFIDIYYDFPRFSLVHYFILFSYV